MSEQHHGRDYGGDAAQNYERYFVSSIGAPLAKDLVEMATLRPGERVLDVACGTGVVARLASQAVGPSGRVAGLDVNPGMLAAARAAVPPGVSIDWHEASAEEMPLPDASFDVVLCQMGLQFMKNKHSALREMHRVLSSDGRLILNVPGPTPQPFAILGEALARHVSHESAKFVSQIFSLHDTAEVENLIKGAGFREVFVQPESKPLRLPAPEEFLWQYVYSTPLAGAVAAVADERRALLEREVVAKWQTFVSAGAFMLEVRMVAGTARK